MLIEMIYVLSLSHKNNYIAINVDTHITNLNGKFSRLSHIYCEVNKTKQTEKKI